MRVSINPRDGRRPSVGAMTDTFIAPAGLGGEVIEPGSPGYETARLPALARYHHIRPRAVVRCASAEDVARALDVAGRSGLPVVPRGGGHCFAGRSSTEGL